MTFKCVASILCLDCGRFSYFATCLHAGFTARWRQREAAVNRLALRARVRTCDDATEGH